MDILWVGMAVTTIGLSGVGMLIDDPRLIPVPLWLSMTTCAMLTLAGLGLIITAFVRPCTSAGDEPQTTRLASRPTSRQTRWTRIRMFAAAGIVLAWMAVFIIAGGIRYGWAGAAFRGWWTSSLWWLVPVVVFLIGGIVTERDPFSVPREDERELLIKTKAAATTSRIMVLVCVGAEVLLMEASFAFGSKPLMYVGLGFLAALVIHTTVSMIVRSYYDNRM
ncbi:hypothetical protein [Bifidobacterium stellenboschense]|nr:hypothetical protein [Bifidobacterium stellenboschense]